MRARRRLIPATISPALLPPLNPVASAGSKRLPSPLVFCYSSRLCRFLTAFLTAYKANGHPRQFGSPPILTRTSSTGAFELLESVCPLIQMVSVAMQCTIKAAEIRGLYQMDRVELYTSKLLARHRNLLCLNRSRHQRDITNLLTDSNTVSSSRIGYNGRYISKNIKYIYGSSGSLPIFGTFRTAEF